MTFDKPVHKAFVLEAMKATSIPWEHVELAAEIKQAMQCAEIKADADDSRS